MPLNRKSYLQIAELPAEERSTDGQARWRKWIARLKAALENFRRQDAELEKRKNEQPGMPGTLF